MRVVNKSKNFQSFLKPAILASMASLDKEQLEHLERLARLDLDPASEEKMLADFAGIFEHFQQLQELPPRGAENLRGERVPLRDDEESAANSFREPEKLVAQFPETEGRHNRIPPVF